MSRRWGTVPSLPDPPPPPPGAREPLNERGTLRAASDELDPLGRPQPHTVGFTIADVHLHYNNATIGRGAMHPASLRVRQLDESAGVVVVSTRTDE